MGVSNNKGNNNQVEGERCLKQASNEVLEVFENIGADSWTKNFWTGYRAIAHNVNRNLVRTFVGEKEYE